MSGKHDKIQSFLQSLPVDNSDGDPRYLAYFQCFNSGLYYEAHDVLEDLWLQHRHGPRYAFHKGLIQLAGAFVHLQKGRLRPASALFRLCLQYLSPFQPWFQALNITTTCSLARTWDSFLTENQFQTNPLHILPAPQLLPQFQLPPHQLPTRSQTHIAVFCKAPRAGLVKTRIAQSLDAHQARDIYQQLLLHTLDACLPFSHVTLHYTPHDPLALQELAPWLFHPQWKLQPQCGSDLGARLAHASQSSLTSHPQGLLIIGSDCPDLQSTDLAEAWIQLQSGQSEIVLGPAADGGYWLIGLKIPCPTLFEGIDWSTDQVLHQTRQRALQAGLRIHELRVLEDVDTVESWNRWQKVRAERQSETMN